MIPAVYTVISVLVFTILYSYTAVGVLFVMILLLLHLKRPVRFIIRLWAKSVFLIMGRKLTINGLDNIARNEKYILVANHTSLFDIVAITSFYPEVSWFGHERLLKVPVFGLFLKMTDYVPFSEPTFRNTRHMLDQLIQKSKQQSVALFPEGTRTLSGKINPFYRGFIYLSRTRNMAILPVTLNGFYDLKPKNRFYIDFSSKLSIVIHKPISADQLLNKSDNEIISTVRSVIESAFS